MATLSSGHDALGDPPSVPDHAGPAKAATEAAVVARPDADSGFELTPIFAREAVNAALRAAGFAEEEIHLSRMASRARTAGLLPELWLRAARTTDDSLRLSPTAGDPYNFTEIGGAGWWLEARLVFHFDRLLFDRDEVPIERLRRERSDSAAKLVNKVLGTLFDWQRANAVKMAPAAAPEDRDRAALSALEAEITLDVLTAGWFSTQIEKPGTHGGRP